ncbi:hypothetical protein BKG71_25740 [Mycobacteroides chelonae]|nr:hypothetical protein BKG63_24025 [Mycobacteroides chelonae]OHT90689.1 hypothetical protein BKG71_25740 [Mycobacteroides chelonae]OHT99545.1 hypothetical protein BKG72_03695 [Mycobacteroides chelonae]OLT92922.1 hypothetical protein BKG59_05685 [Mycobacteroides chelonae]
MLLDTAVVVATGFLWPFWCACLVLAVECRFMEVLAGFLLLGIAGFIWLGDSGGGPKVELEDAWW